MVVVLRPLKSGKKIFNSEWVAMSQTELVHNLGIYWSHGSYTKSKWQLWSREHLHTFIY